MVIWLYSGLTAEVPLTPSPSQVVGCFPSSVLGFDKTLVAFDPRIADTLSYG